MLLAYVVMITGLAISAVAIYYSVAGLVAIFAAAAIPIIIMGSVLEVGKLVTAVWLHKYWSRATWWLKSYLSIAVLVLMFITSMGIFGFLSKAHIDQTSSATEGIAQIERIDVEITRYDEVLERARAEIVNIETNGNSQDTIVEDQIDREQGRIDSAYERVQPAINEQLTIIERADNRLAQRINPLQAEADAITQLLSELQQALANDEIERAQGIVGTPVDGNYGSNTAQAVEDFRDAQGERRDALRGQISAIRAEPDVNTERARTEIQRIRTSVEEQIAESNVLISRLRGQLGSVDVDELTTRIEQQQIRINEANQAIDALTEQKFGLEAEYRKLEAEVGPVKYLAEFIYGEEANKDLLEEAVRWVIITIIFVFDPLAVLLLIASQYTFEIHRKERAALSKEKENDKPLNRNDGDSNLGNVGNDQEDSNTRGSRSTPKLGEEHDTLSRAADNGGDLVLQRQREIEWNDETKLSEKQAWKADHPEETLKEYKDAYIKGRIDTLPWDNYINKND
jgi:peptidoglycan hydrolase-like protein with peptidoglycan-binding domain